MLNNIARYTRNAISNKNTRHLSSATLPCISASAESYIIRSSKKLPQESLEPWISRSVKAREMAQLLNTHVGFSHLKEVSDLSYLTKVPKDSLLSVVLPFGSDSGFKERYVNHWGQLRVGRLFEEIDVFAGMLGFFLALNAMEQLLMRCKIPPS